MKWSRFLLVNGTFLLAMLVLTSYWAASFGDYVQSKGDESTSFVGLVLVVAYTAFAANAALVGGIGWRWALVLPLILCLLASFSVFAVLMLLGLPGYPEELIIAYGIAYSFLSISALVRSNYRRSIIVP